MRIKQGRFITIAVLIMIMLPVLDSYALQIISGARHTPEQTGEGTFLGTWFYVDRDQRFALFFKEEAGKIKAKIMWYVNSEESFETDWDGKCAYMFRGYEGNVSLQISNPGNKELLEGKWLWQYRFVSSERIESGTFKMYRFEKGFKLAWIMPDWARVVKAGDKEKGLKLDQMHILRKASNRIISWEEIPFD